MRESLGRRNWGTWTNNAVIVEVGTGMDSGALGGCGGAHWIILLARGAVDIDSAYVVVGESSGKGNE
jgi:hypothetical protein